jgi:hypothetical protein
MTVLSIELIPVACEKDDKSGVAVRENPGECEKVLYTVFTEFLSILSHFPGSVAFLPGLVAPGLVAPGFVAPGFVAPGLVAPALVGLPFLHMFMFILLLV